MGESIDKLSLASHAIRLTRSIRSTPEPVEKYCCVRPHDISYSTQTRSIDQSAKEARHKVLEEVYTKRRLQYKRYFAKLKAHL